ATPPTAAGAGGPAPTPPGRRPSKRGTCCRCRRREAGPSRSRAHAVGAGRAPARLTAGGAAGVGPEGAPADGPHRAPLRVAVRLRVCAAQYRPELVVLVAAGQHGG